MLLLERWRIIYNYTKFGSFYKGFLQLSKPHLVHIIKPVIKVGGAAKFVINIFEIRFLILLTKTRTLLTRTINLNAICRKQECNSTQWDRHPEFITNHQWSSIIMYYQCIKYLIQPQQKHKSVFSAQCDQYRRTAPAGAWFGDHC